VAGATKAAIIATATNANNDFLYISYLLNCKRKYTLFLLGTPEALKMFLGHSRKNSKRANTLSPTYPSSSLPK
jgi:hypothetical protein